MMHTVIIGSPNEVRVEAFQRALAGKGYAPATVVAYPALLRGEVHLASIIQAGTLLRIESPGKDDAANTALLARGEHETDDDGTYTRIDATTDLAKGRIGASRQWYLGLRALMRDIATQLADCAPHTLMNHPDDISIMFDKRACHALLMQHNVPVPPALPAIKSFDELEAVMQAHGVRRVFVKLAHGSSASGVVAYQTNGREHRATAAVEMVKTGAELHLYNTRRMQTYAHHAEIATLINALCQHRVHVEQWIPKARMGSNVFDLRVVVIGGTAAHTVARLSQTPITNLHLLNERTNRETVMHHLGAENFQAAMTTCEQAMACFPKSLYAGIDLLIAPNLRHNYVLEMNAFGDLLHNATYNDLDTYSLELERATV